MKKEELMRKNAIKKMLYTRIGWNMSDEDEYKGENDYEDIIIDKLCDLSVPSILELNEMETDIIRARTGVYNNKIILLEELATKYNTNKSRIGRAEYHATYLLSRYIIYKCAPGMYIMPTKEELLERNISFLELSGRVTIPLIRLMNKRDIKIKELLELSTNDLKKRPGGYGSAIGKKGIAEIQQSLKPWGLSLKDSPTYKPVEEIFEYAELLAKEETKIEEKVRTNFYSLFKDKEIEEDLEGIFILINDPSYKTILNLDEIETYVLRIKIGMESKGKLLNAEELAKYSNTSVSESKNILNNGIGKINRYLGKEQNKDNDLDGDISIEKLKRKLEALKEKYEESLKERERLETNLAIKEKELTLLRKRMAESIRILTLNK